MKKSLGLIALAACVLAACANGDPSTDDAEDTGQTSSALGGKPTLSPHRSLASVRGAGAGAATGATGPMPIAYGGGPVMHAAHVYFIWYGPGWTNAGAARAVLTDLARSIGGSRYFDINGSYGDGTAGAATSVQFSGETLVGHTRGTSLSEGMVWAIVGDAIASRALPSDTDGVYFVLGDASVTQTGPNGAFCTDFCGWHTNATRGTANLKYAFIGDPSSCSPSLCTPSDNAVTSPNGHLDTDAMASVFAHELSETVTDPNGDAWRTLTGVAPKVEATENADVCAWTFGTTYAAPNGARANIALGGRNYLLQQNLVPQGGLAPLSQHRSWYCAMTPDLPPQPIPVPTQPPVVSPPPSTPPPHKSCGVCPAHTKCNPPTGTCEPVETCACGGHWPNACRPCSE